MSKPPKAPRDKGWDILSSMTQPNQSELREDEALILFMAQLGWAYGNYDDQCFHVFDSSGNNTMTRKTASALKAYITANYTQNSEVEHLTPHLTPRLTPKKLPRFEQ